MKLYNPVVFTSVSWTASGHVYFIH